MRVRTGRKSSFISIGECGLGWAGLCVLSAPSKVSSPTALS